jgi:hypothetical protein
MAMDRIEENIAEYWRNYLESRPDCWIYTEILKMALALSNYDTDKTLKFLEFCLLSPHVFARGREDEFDLAELEPPWRFHRLATFVKQAGLEARPLEEVVSGLCDTAGWMPPQKVIEETKRYILANPPTWYGETDFFDSVWQDFIRMQLECITMREETPLMGFEYLVRSDLRPPLHRKLLPNGTMELHTYEDCQLATAWMDFFLASQLMIQVVKKETVKCPIAFARPAATFPDAWECTCEAEKKFCFMRGLIYELGVVIESLV